MVKKKTRDSTLDEPLLEFEERDEGRPGDRDTVHIHHYQAPPTQPLMDLIPFGRFHILMLLMCGLGWMQDNYWGRVIGDISKTVVEEKFKMDGKWDGIPATVQFTGMALGSFFWGWASDFFGRKIAFISTLFIAGIFGMGMAFAPNFIVFLVTLFFVGFGAGGNLAVDGAIFSEFLPSKQRGPMLVLLSTFWSFGSIIASTQDYFLLPYYDTDRDPDRNSGWRLAIAIPATISVFIGVFRLIYIESPMYLLRKNRVTEATNNLNMISRWNGTPQEFDGAILEMYVPSENAKGFNFGAIFADKKLVFATLLCWSFWFTTNVAYTGFNLFLPELLKKKFQLEDREAYLDNLIYNIAGLPASLLGAWLVETILGRKWSMTVSCTLTAACFLVFNYVGGWTSSKIVIVVIISAINFFAQIMYAAYYTYTPEIFPTSVRSSGMGVAALMGKAASIGTPFPIHYLMDYYSIAYVLWIDFGFMAAGALAMALLPIETRGRQLKS